MKAREVLARTCWGEARGERPVRRAMAAVASVIMNRADNPRWWGRTVIEVCRKPWQFSAWNPDDVNRRQLLAVTESNPEFRIALEIADEALAGQLEDETRNSDHFHTIRARPLWSQGRQPTITIGNHRFFRIELREKGRAADVVNLSKRA